jgi:RNA-directed DNA polymerase
MHKELDKLIIAKQALEEWLKPLGLELKPSKTRICHTLNQIGEEKPGFDFLGFNIRHYPTGQARSLKCKGKKLGFKLTIKPSKEKVKEHLRKIKGVIRKHKSSPQYALIKRLNPIIRGWSKYYSTVVSKETFSLCDHQVWQKLRRWAKCRHNGKSSKWIMRKYWRRIDGAIHFATKENYRLLKHAETPIKRFAKARLDKSPYDGDWVYWSNRMGKNPNTSNRIAMLLKRQKGKCPFCNNYFNSKDLMEIDHIIPKVHNGKDTLTNLQLLHRHCHDHKTSTDGSVRGCVHNKDYPNEEPCAVKVASTVLQMSRSGDTSA